ncbi:MAG: RNHCP domain-containing protein [Clostridia bacterium]|nr:RNHCP domain-containing protein [Clostridia bacterium]
MFIKNDNEFVCINCSKPVDKLRYTSRDHCNFCLHSIHVDIEPGDRKNECMGLLIPVNVEVNSKKGEVIIYKCMKCGKMVRNIVAKDDDRTNIYSIVEKYAKNGGDLNGRN